MYYPTVTEHQVRLEPLGHDPFIDNLEPAELQPEPQPEQRPRRLAGRRRIHAGRSERRLRARLT